VIDLGRSCNRHRALLVDFLDRGEVRPGTASALAHLDRCDRCIEAIESTLLTITALRRLGDAVSESEPRADAWPRLRVRIQSLGPRRPRVMSPLAGVAMSFGLVAVLILPFRFGGGGLLGPVASPVIDRSSGAVTLADRQIEANYIAMVRQGTLPGAAGGSGPTATSHQQNYPDNIRPNRKEVGPAEPTGRPPEAI
jgi:anti-sigma factor RsiW